MKKNNAYPIVFLLLTLLISCSKNSPNTYTPPVKNGVYTLNQGTYGSNNTTLTYYDFNSGVQTTDYYRNVNGFALGATGSDFIVYGGKMYIVMNASGYVAVAQNLTARFIDTISFQNGSSNRGPENIQAYGSKVFVSSTDGTVAVIDTTTLTIDKFITVGSNPAQMTISGTNLYVSNTGGFSAPNYDSTVSVIDLNSLTETEKITVGINPGSLTADNVGNLYVVCTGDYNTVGPKLVKFSLANKEILLTADSAAGTISYFDNALYTTGGYLGAAKVGILSTADFSAIRPSFVTDGTGIENPYGLDIDPATGDVYVGDAKDYTSSGEVFCFDNTGKKKFSYSVSPGISPIRTLLIHP